MNALIQKINFSTLSKGEQSEVYRIIQKVHAGKPVTEKEEQFISDMSARGEQSKHDPLNSAWAAMVSLVGVNAGLHVLIRLERAFAQFKEPDDTKAFGQFKEPEVNEAFKILFHAFTKAVEPLGGHVTRPDKR